jgi:outer membrane protein assembly factor BamB
LLDNPVCSTAKQIFSRTRIEINTMRLQKHLAGLALLTSILSLSAAEGDWPQWRGPNRDGISTESGLLKQWPADGPPLAWKAAGLGEGYSSVSVAGGRIFTMGEGPNASYVRAFESTQGKPLWSTEVGRPGGGGGYPGPRCTPTVDGELVFALGQHGDLVCVEAGTGKLRWRKNLVKDFNGRVMSDWGYSESPLVDGDKLICTPGGSKGTLLALDKKTGALIWRGKDLTDAAAYSSVITATSYGQRHYIQLTGEHVAGFATQDGSLLWKAQRRGSTAVISTPIYFDNHVYVTSAYGVGCNLFKLAAQGDKLSATQVYKDPAMANHHGGVIRIGGHVYGYSDGKGWVCQQLLSGKLAWSDKRAEKGALVYADGHFYLRSEGTKGTVTLIEASPQGYIEKGHFDQPNRSKANSWAHPVIAGGKLYLRDQDTLLCYDVKEK